MEEFHRPGGATLKAHVTPSQTQWSERRFGHAMAAFPEVFRVAAKGHRCKERNKPRGRSILLTFFCVSRKLLAKVDSECGACRLEHH